MQKRTKKGSEAEDIARDIPRDGRNMKGRHRSKYNNEAGACPQYNLLAQIARLDIPGVDRT